MQAINLDRSMKATPEQYADIMASVSAVQPQTTDEIRSYLSERDRELIDQIVADWVQLTPNAKLVILAQIQSCRSAS